MSVHHPQQSKTITAVSAMALTMNRPTSPYSSGSDTESILLQSASTTPTTALRRLYFKSAKTGKLPITTNKGSSVPKVIVMSSSTNSEATINTSTESASTHFTNITTTTDTETLDSSLDLGGYF